MLQKEKPILEAKNFFKPKHNVNGVGDVDLVNHIDDLVNQKVINLSRNLGF